MTEDNVAREINKLIDNKGIAEVNINTFMSLWFHNKKFNERDMTEHFLRFKDTYGLDYILILNHRKGVSKVRFWRKTNENEQKLIKEKSELSEA